MIKGVFLKPAATGRPPRDPRTIVDGILWILRTGSPWRDLPEEYLIELGIRPVVPSKENEDCDARPVESDKTTYRHRSIVERLIGWLKESRRISSRFEKTGKDLGGMVKMAFVEQYVQHDVQLGSCGKA